MQIILICKEVMANDQNIVNVINELIDLMTKTKEDNSNMEKI